MPGVRERKRKKEKEKEKIASGPNKKAQHKTQYVTMFSRLIILTRIDFSHEECQLELRILLSNCFMINVWQCELKGSHPLLRKRTFLTIMVSCPWAKCLTVCVCVCLVRQVIRSLNSCEESNAWMQLCALRAKVGPGNFLGISALVYGAAPTVTYLPEATTVLAHRVFSMLRLSLTGGSPSSWNSWDNKYTEWRVETETGQIITIFVL